MFRNSFQSGFLSILYSVGSQPLLIWDRRVENGHIKRISDEDVKSQVVEISGTNVATTYIFCPQDPKVSLGIKLKFFVMIIKNLNKYFSFEITVLDHTYVRRRLRASNYQSTIRVRPFSCSMPMALNRGWNQIQFNLADFTRRAYGTEYIETTRIQIHANCRIRRVYFADKLYTEDDVPPEYRLYVNDDPRTRRFSEPATAMTSVALTAAAIAGRPRPINCSGAVAAPPTPCGGDVIPEEAEPLPEKMQSFINAQPLHSADVLPSYLPKPSYLKEKAASKPPSVTTQDRAPSPQSKASTFVPIGYQDLESMGTMGIMASGSMAPATGSLVPMVVSKPPSAAVATPVYSPRLTSLAEGGPTAQASANFAQPSE